MSCFVKIYSQVAWRGAVRVGQNIFIPFCKQQIVDWHFSTSNVVQLKPDYSN